MKTLVKASIPTSGKVTLTFRTQTMEGTFPDTQRTISVSDLLAALRRVDVPVPAPKVQQEQMDTIVDLLGVLAYSSLNSPTGDRVLTEAGSKRRGKLLDRIERKLLS